MESRSQDKLDELAAPGKNKNLFLIKPKSTIMQENISAAEKETILKNNLEHTLFSWSKQAGLNPIKIHHAEGVYLYDYDGKRYIDFSSQLMNVNIGHGNTKVRDAIPSTGCTMRYTPKHRYATPTSSFQSKLPAP